MKDEQYTTRPSKHERTVMLKLSAIFTTANVQLLPKRIIKVSYKPFPSLKGPRRTINHLRDTRIFNFKMTSISLGEGREQLDTYTKSPPTVIKYTGIQMKTVC